MGQSVGDTICAIATPMGEGGIGVVRISGPKALAVGNKVVRLRSNRPLDAVSSHRLYMADIISPRFARLSGQISLGIAKDLSGVIDEALVVVMKAPRSFTGEDVVEIHCHGSQIVLRLVCEACLDAGARLGEPGEFTKRAFLNGRLDLSQAEAVLDTIRAKSEAGLRMAQRHLRGELGRLVDKLRNRLLSLLCEVEAGIDFGEEDITFVDPHELGGVLEDTLVEINQMLGHAETGGRLREGARIVITGPPNVGKSSLLNRLLGYDRAIVTEIPGTTRDVIEETVIWDGLMITLVDTAGLRDTCDPVEQEGIKRTRAAIEQADLVLQVKDATGEKGEDSHWASSVLDGRATLTVMNKCDLKDITEISQAAKELESRTRDQVIITSAKTGVGIEQLREAIRTTIGPPILEVNDSAIITNVRHKHALERAMVSIQEAREAVRSGAAAECVAIDLRSAADALGEVTGAITSEEILNRIFSEFCIGK